MGHDRFEVIAGGASRMGVIPTAGQRVAFASSLRWVSELIDECADGTFEPRAASEPSLVVQVEDNRRPFDTAGWAPLNRDAWSRDGSVVVRDVCTSGFDLRVHLEKGVPCFTFRWRPSARTRALGAALPARATLIARAALLHYPAVWWSGTRQRAPLHASAVVAGHVTMLLAGASGVGKTTLVVRELDAGGVATGDNVSVADGETVWGVVEPTRAEAGSGRAMPHGRRETRMPNRVPALRPDCVALLQRGEAEAVEPFEPDLAARALVASTYVAGELRRYWTFAALLALGTGLGPAHPPVGEVANALAGRLPCLSITLPSIEGVRLAALLERSDVQLWT